MTITGEVSLDVLLDFVKRGRGFDFTGYKRTSLERRVRKRMAEVDCASYGAYLDRLEVDPDEFAQLFNTILINVTGFFRDAATWDHLRQEVLPELLAARPPDAPVRVWCAGCATGEEPYTMAMVLADLLGEQAYRERVKIYATDVDEEALQAARAATYSAKQVEPVPPAALDACFERVEGGYCFRPDLRRTVIFGRNDLVQDAPISRIDVLLCRNTLMYFNADTQADVLRRLHFALNDSGILVLGKSEMLTSRRELFAAVDLKRRVFRKVVGGVAAERRGFPGEAEAGPAPDGDATLRETAFERAPVAQVVVDVQGRVAAANQAARELLGVGAAELGRPLQDLELSYRPIELRSELERVRAHRRPHTVSSVAFQPAAGGHRVLDVELTPLLDDGRPVGTTISFLDVTLSQGLQEELRRSKHDLERAYEELQSTVEELETTNEELQSTNEELTTSKEELQSLNEELQTVNQELQSKVDELSRSNNDMNNLLNSTDIATLFLDGDLRVRRFTTQTSRLIKLIPGDAGRPITDMATDLDYPDLADDAREVLRTLVFHEKLVGARGGRWYNVRILPYRTLENVIDGVVVTFPDASAIKRRESSLRQQTSQLKQLAESLPNLVFGCTPNGTCDYLNRQWVDYTGVPEAEHV
ncbi:MAG TPA: CheR family methyltransferase, partial [Baekduia sp.]|nr:CheR family methyltransferase [Baekduia sp.]